MKINWGTKLAFFAIAFMVFVVTMVVIISRQDVPLVEENYYEKGLNYQKQIDNNQSLGNQVVLHLVQNEVVLINASNQKIETGKLGYYRPSDPGMDKGELVNTPIEPGDTASFMMPELEKGKWKVSFSWKWENKDYLLEKEFER